MFPSHLFAKALSEFTQSPQVALGKHNPDWHSELEPHLTPKHRLLEVDKKFSQGVNDNTDPKEASKKSNDTYFLIFNI